MDPLVVRPYGHYDPFSTSSPLGPRVLTSLDPSQVTLDIWFVHGLFGNRETTWTHKNGTFWPQLLADDFPSARVITYGYDGNLARFSKLWSGADNSGPDKYGRDLAFAVRNTRSGDYPTTAVTAPIYFIGHSFGGQVIEQALITSLGVDDTLHSVAIKTAGIIFMGTPHHASLLRVWGRRLQKTIPGLIPIWIDKTFNDQYLDDLYAKSDIWQKVEGVFQSEATAGGLRDVRMFCCYETTPMVGSAREVVPRAAAIMEWDPSAPISGNHREIVQFEDKKDDGYVKVANELRLWTSKPPPNAARRMLTGELTKSGDINVLDSDIDSSSEWTREASAALRSQSLYRPLSIELYEIRLLTIRPHNNFSHTISCTLECVSLFDYPQYEALSYCWGDPTITEAIEVDGIPTYVTTNLATALRQLRSQGHTTLWVDALCINQGDREERAVQVNRMKDIYSQATEVIVWVGLEDEHSTNALDFMEFLGRAPPEREAAVQERAQSAESGRYREAWKSCDIFFERPYWHRVWIIQEIAVAAKVHVQCGSRVISWNDLKETLLLAKVVNLESFRDSVEKRQLRTLLEALYDSRASLATDPRDKVYALLGLTSDGNEIIRFPNYKQPVETILKQMTKAILMRGGRLDLITLRNHDRIDRVGLPSWVPDWTELADAVKAHTQHQFSPGHRGDDLARHLECFEFNGDELRVTGRASGTICAISTSLYESGLEGSLIDYEKIPYDKMAEDCTGAVLFDTDVDGKVEMETLMRDQSPSLIQWIHTNREMFVRGRPLQAYFITQKSPMPIDVAFNTSYHVERGLKEVMEAVILTRKRENELEMWISRLNSDLVYFAGYLIILRETQDSLKSNDLSEDDQESIEICQKNIDDTQKWHDQAQEGIDAVQAELKEVRKEVRKDSRIHLIKQVLKHGKKLFVATDGSFGITHAQARKGDEICLLRGCNIPVLLRRCEDGWTVIGEAPINGLPESDTEQGAEEFRLR